MRSRLDFGLVGILALGAWIGSPAVSSGLVIRAVAIDRDEPSHLVVSVAGKGLVRSEDSGRTWLPAGSGISDEVTAIVSAGAGTLVAGTKSGVYRSLDGGTTWTHVLAAGAAVALAAAPSSDSVLYATGDFVFARSIDRGATWTTGAPGLPSRMPFLGVDAADPSTVYAVASGVLFRSRDAGSSWAPTPFPLPTYGLGGVSGAAFDPRRPGTLYAVDVICGLGCVAELLSTTDGGETQSQVWNSSRIPSVSVDDASTLFASTLTELLRSRDGGASFERIGSEIPFEVGSSPFPITILVSSPRSPMTVAATSTGQLWASEDHGSSWRRLAETGSLCDVEPVLLCLGGGRFRATVHFGTSNDSAFPIRMTSDAGGFWFFSPNNVEVVVKVVDGRAFNGRFWVFVAGLSDVRYVVTVTDLETGAVREYVNAAGELASRSDTAAF
jgi:photosystem II stability/assembly factor-like uncharacterized protein